ncbi:MAG: hypothetical protein CNIPEHKO_02652 [Anaerolineales bacterium]|nr:hypothetical protein [Anaerolineales bacterium]
MTNSQKKLGLSEFWSKEFLTVELLYAVLFLICFFVWYAYFSGEGIVEQVLQNNRDSIYGALAAIFGALLGFVITAVSIVIGYSASDQFAIVRNSTEYPKLWRIFISAIRATALATIAALLGLILDRDISPNRWILFLNVYAIALVLIRLWRSIWVLEQIINIITGN